MTTITVTEARATLPELLDRVADGDEVTITRHGRPVAVLLRPDRLRLRRAAAEAAIAEGKRIGELIADAGQKPLPRGGLTAERAEELVREIRADRDGL